MFKKVLVNIIIFILLFSLNTYAINETTQEAPKNNVQNETEKEQTEVKNNNEEKNQSKTENNTTTNNQANQNKTENNTTTNNQTNQNKTENNTTINNQTNQNKTENNTTNSNNKINNNTVVSTNAKPSTNEIEKPKSKEAKLKTLEIDVEGMTPNFDKDITEYYLITGLDTEKIEVKATPVSNKAKVKIVGNSNLKEGKNTIAINVTAENGNEKKYYIYVTKSDNIERADATLKSLQVEGFSIYPAFKPDIYIYNINLKENTTSVEILAKAEKEKATVEIIGNNDLKERENLIKIIVTAEDGTTVKTYKINAFVSVEGTEIEKESKLPAIILLVVIGTSIIGLIIFIIRKTFC